jgi:hypothetical protein
VKRKYKRRRKNNYGLLLDGKDMVRRKDFGWTGKIIMYICLSHFPPILVGKGK